MIEVYKIVKRNGQGGQSETFSSGGSSYREGEGGSVVSGGRYSGRGGMSEVGSSL